MTRNPLFLVLLLTSLLNGCASFPSPAARKQRADQLAAGQGWQASELHTATFTLTSYGPEYIQAANRLTIYLEGDGFSWITPELPSTDPTPIDPLALKLALAQPAGSAVYLARPCQYGDAETSHCDSRYWQQARFAPEVVAATSQAIDQLKAKYQAHRLSLVGFSGGGAVALLVAARRQDVDQVVTVAGNVSIRDWTDYHQLTPLTGSLDPVNDINQLAKLHLTLLSGADDSNIPPLLAQGFAERFPQGQQPTTITLPGFDHHCCWVTKWPDIWQKDIAH